MDEHLKLLGFKVRDVVTGFQGVVTSISFDLYGCVQAIVTPEFSDGKQGDSHWFDAKRLEPQSAASVMPVPDFASVPARPSASGLPIATASLKEIL